MSGGEAADARATCERLVAALREAGSEENRAGQARYGINVERALGVSVYDVRRIAKGHKRDHALAGCLWATGIHDAQMMAAFVDDPAAVTPEQMEAWAAEFDSWDITDQVSTSLFHETPYAWDKAIEWAARDDEWIKRAGFAIMAGLGWHDKTAADERFEPFFAAIEREAGDPRNFVKKAVNWALRNIGKRNPRLNEAAVACARRIQRAAGGPGARGGTPQERAARWIANDALRELTSEKVRARMGM